MSTSASGCRTGAATSTLPATRSPRTVDQRRGYADIDLAGRHVGVIGYDATLIPDAELVRTAGRVLAIAIDRQRLDAELRASHDALRESRSRIVEATDVERRRIARDLHDGLQGRMILLGIRARRLADRLPDGEEHTEAESVRSGLEVAIDELRNLVHGVMPALLIERGLQAATEELVDRMPIPTELAAARGRSGRCRPRWRAPRSSSSPRAWRTRSSTPVRSGWPYASTWSAMIC